MMYKMMQLNLPIFHNFIYITRITYLHYSALHESRDFRRHAASRCRVFFNLDLHSAWILRLRARIAHQCNFHVARTRAYSGNSRSRVGEPCIYEGK